MLSQLNFTSKVTYDNFKSGLLIILWGLFKKLVIADRLAIFVNTVYDKPSGHDGITLIIATIFFAIQIYCDFSGYTDIAIGVSRLFGVNLTKNFKAPYFAKNIPEFWRRWHITLGAWFKEYLYIPLGGNKSGNYKVFFNLMIVFVVSGIWHGASWNFFIWGFLHGIYMISYSLSKPIRDRYIEFFKIDRDSISHKLTSIVVTFTLVNIAWVFFRANTFEDTIIIFKGFTKINLWTLFSGELYKLGLNNLELFVVVLMIVIMLLVEWFNHKNSLISFLKKQTIAFRWILYFILIFSIMFF